MRTDFTDEEQDDASPCDKTKYQTLLGMLIFVIRSRPDIAYAVNRLATRCAGKGPTTKDLEALKRVIRYLKTTAHLELVYAAGSSATADAIFTLYAWSDAAYLTHKDSKSHSGTCFAYGDEPTGKFYAASQKQKTTTLSSTESETYAATEAAKDIILLLPQCTRRTRIPTIPPHATLHRQQKHHHTRLQLLRQPQTRSPLHGTHQLPARTSRQEVHRASLPPRHLAPSRRAHQAQASR